MPTSTPSILVEDIPCIIPENYIRDYLLAVGITQINNFKVQPNADYSVGRFLLSTSDLESLNASNVNVRFRSESNGATTEIVYNDLIIIESSMIITPVETDDSISIVTIADKRYYSDRSYLGVGVSLFPTTNPTDAHPDAQEEWVDIFDEYWKHTELEPIPLDQSEADYPSVVMKDVRYVRPTSAIKVITDVLAMIGHGLFLVEGPALSYKVLPLKEVIEDNTTLLELQLTQDRLIQKKFNRHIELTFVPQNHVTIFLPENIGGEEVRIETSNPNPSGFFDRLTTVFNCVDDTADMQTFAEEISALVFDSYATANQIDAVYFDIVPVTHSPRCFCVEYYYDVLSQCVKTKIVSHRADNKTQPLTKRESSGSVELRRCSDNQTVYSDDVDVGSQKLLDLVGSVVNLQPSPLLESDCWRVIGPSDCTPQICPVVCSILPDCTTCGGCFVLQLCTDTSVIRRVTVPTMCGATSGVIQEGDIVLLDDGLCYEVFNEFNCDDAEELGSATVVPNCEACGDCWPLTHCFNGPPLSIFKDNHPITEGQIVEIGGECYTVGPESTNCVDAIRIPQISPSQIYDNCETCGGCFELTPCESGTPPILANSMGIGFDFSEVLDKVVRLDNGLCYSVAPFTGDCSAGQLVTVQESYDDCTSCLVYVLEECGGSGVLTTYSDLSAYGDGAVIKRAEDETCYMINGITDWAPTSIETTVEESFPTCPDCTDPRFKLDPVCPSCEEATPGLECEVTSGATQVAGSGSVEYTDDDLSDYLGRYIKIDGVCYLVERDPTRQTPTLSDLDITITFDDCQQCQRECIFLNVDVFDDGQVIGQRKIRAVVDMICDEITETIVSTTDECPPESQSGN